MQPFKPERLAACKELLKRLNYDPETGFFVWIKGATPQVTARCVGKRAGRPSSRGYRALRMKIDGRRKNIAEHILAYVAMTGEYPPMQIDHIDRVRSNNAWHNLRLATQPQQNANSALKGGTSQYRGVSWYKRSSKWRADINIDGKLKYLGSFVNEQDAARAYDKAALEKYGPEFYTPNLPDTAQ